MKLYYSPGACSLAVHIALEEVGAAFDLEQVDLTSKRTETGADFLAVNPLGYVPTVELDDGETMFEASALLELLADRYPGARLAPAAGTFARHRMQQYLAFTASELHKAFNPFFAAEKPDAEARSAAVSRVASRLDFLEATLADGRSYLLGDAYSIADIYAFVVANWAGPSQIELDRWPRVRNYVARIAARPQVAVAMRREGLMH